MPDKLLVCVVKLIIEDDAEINKGNNVFETSEAIKYVKLAVFAVV
jgi:hypothetical protein